MQVSRSAVFFLLLLLQLAAAAQKKQSLLTKKYPPATLQQDALIFRDVLLSMHPSIGIYRPREYYYDLLNTFIGSLKDSLTEKDFRLKIKLVADQLHCGHTEVLHSNAFYKEIRNVKMNFSPYIFLPVEDKVYMLATLNKKKDTLLKKGTEITSINGITVDSMLRHARRFVSSDGYIETARRHYVQLGFNSYYVSLFGRPDTFNVEYTEGNQVRHARYAAFKPKALPSLPLGPRDDSSYVKYRRAAMKYKFLDEDKKTMHLMIARFSNVGSERAYRKVFRKLRKNRSNNLIIDLRNNGGGSLSNSYRLLSYLIDTPQTQTLRTAIRNYPLKKYTSGNVFFRFTRFAYKLIGEKKTVNDTDYFVYTIKPRKRNHFGGKILVLINGGSFSASSLVAAYIKSTGRAVFIGEETGGAIEGCNAGITPYYTLPNTKIRVRVPAFRIVHDVSPNVTGQGIRPDHPVTYGFKEIIGRRDLELEKAREILKIK